MWDRCWSTAVVRLGLTTEQFFRLTPRQLRVLADRDHEFLEMQREHIELLAGIITANTVNYSFCHPKHAKAPADFMPSRMGKSRSAPKALIAQNIRCFLQAQTKLRNKCPK
jgi:hypothetical protein